MGTLKITEDMKTPAGEQQVFFFVDATGCTVKSMDRPPVSVTWDKLRDDVDALAETFADWTVREFKVVVPVLGRLYDKQQLLNDLL